MNNGQVAAVPANFATLCESNGDSPHFSWRWKIILGSTDLSKQCLDYPLQIGRFAFRGVP